MKEDIDKTVKAIVSLVLFYKDIVDNKNIQGKITWYKWAWIVIKNLFKIIPLLKSIHEISEEIKDIDSDEAAELVFEVAKLIDPNDKNKMITQYSADTVEGLLKTGHGTIGLIKELKKKAE